MPPGRDRDDRLVEWIDEFVGENYHAPTVREVATEFGMESTSTAMQWLERLRKEGRVTWQEGSARTLSTVKV